MKWTKYVLLALLIGTNGSMISSNTALARGTNTTSGSGKGNHGNGHGNGGPVTPTQVVAAQVR